MISIYDWLKIKTAKVILKMCSSIWYFAFCILMLKVATEASRSHSRVGQNDQNKSHYLLMIELLF